MTLKKLLLAWLCCALAAFVGVAVSLSRLDMLIAHLFAANLSRTALISRGLGSAVLVSGEMSVMAALVAVRLAKGFLPWPAKALLVATLASLTAYVANDGALKVIFGCPNPADVLLLSRQHGFHLFQGTRDSSFPSGHMAMAAGFAFAFSRIYPRALIPMLLGLAVAGVALLVGDWHFFSDVIAGTFVGATAGIAAGELWLQHTRS